MTSSPSVSVPMLTICDAATVRDGLLNVLGAGINDIVRPEGFPAPLLATVAGMLNISHSESFGPLNFSMRFSTREFGDVGIEDLNIEVGNENPRSGEFISAMPIQIDASSIMVPAPGRYRISVLYEGEIMNSVEFNARTEV